jgi:hypothetical protein
MGTPLMYSITHHFNAILAQYMVSCSPSANVLHLRTRALRAAHFHSGSSSAVVSAGRRSFLGPATAPLKSVRHAVLSPCYCDDASASSRRTIRTLVR